MTRLLSFTLPLLSLLTTTLAQTFTDCDPTKKTCPPNQGLGVSNYTIDFTKNMMSDKVWNTTAGTIDYGTAGSEFTINARGDAPTVKTRFYIFFGQVEVIMKAASGQGVVSSIVLQSDDLDEVDWEWIGGNSSYVQTNYFGKGNTTSFDRAVWHTVDNPQDNYHNLTGTLMAKSSAHSNTKTQMADTTSHKHPATFVSVSGPAATPRTPTVPSNGPAERSTTPRLHSR
jgi:hypothetical protein